MVHWFIGYSACDKITAPRVTERTVATFRWKQIHQASSLLRFVSAWDVFQQHIAVSKNSGTPKWIVLIWKTLLKWMIWEYPYFWKHPYTVNMYFFFFSDAPRGSMKYQLIYLNIRENVLETVAYNLGGHPPPGCQSPPGSKNYWYIFSLENQL